LIDSGSFLYDPTLLNFFEGRGSILTHINVGLSMGQKHAQTLKQQRPIGEGDQELEKRLVGEELI
jgi:hypothetical protein